MGGTFLVSSRWEGGIDTFKDDSCSPFAGSYCVLVASVEFGLS